MKYIIPRFPAGFRFMTYLEVFGGGASVLFNKRRSQKEILNDYNGDIIHFYRCVRERPDELIDKLLFVLNARSDWKLAARRLSKQEYDDSLQRAADFYQIFCFSYGGGGKSFGANPRGLWSRFPVILEACERLQGVILENRDFEKVFRTYDSPGTFSYLDPPYYGTEGCYQGFLRLDHERLQKLLLNAQGKWLLSYNDCPEIIEMYSRPGLYIEQIARSDNLAQRYEAGKKYSEFIITNYDTTEFAPKQLSIDQLISPEEETEERKFLWQG